MKGPAVAYSDQIGGHGPGPIRLHTVARAERLPWRALCGVGRISGLYAPERRDELIGDGRRLRPCPDCAKVPRP
jgi:hypothetical protein